MLVGSPLPGTLFGDWRFVDGDLYGVAGRVREYDKDARLITNDERKLALARWVPIYGRLAGGAWALARWCKDPETGEQLVGEPDARVLRDMRAADSHRRNMKQYALRQRDAEVQHDRSRREKLIEAEMPYAERMAWLAYRKDNNNQTFASVPKGI